VVPKVREGLAVSKQAVKKFDVERFNPRALNELEVRKQHQIKISNRFSNLDNLSDSKDINRAWESMKDNIKIPAKESLGLYESKQHKHCFDEEWLGFLEQKKQSKMQWVEDSNQSSVDNLNNVRRGASRHFRNK